MARKKKNPVGRPKLPPKEARTLFIKIRVNQEEAAEIAKGADAAGESVGPWSRGLLLDAAKRASTA